MKKKKTAKSQAKASKPKAEKVKSLKPIKKNFNGLKRYSDVLNSKREDILRTVHGKDVDVSAGDIGDEADVASQTFEREMMFELTNGERMILDDIEAALRRIEKGEFGFCEACHKKITAVRLHAMPWARYCIQCQVQMEAPARA